MKKLVADIASVVFLIAFLSSSSIAQNKSTFEKTFLKETEGSDNKTSNKFRTITNFSFYPDTLPSWFFVPPQSTSSCIYAIGISDPDMERVKAKEMAIHRAKAMAGLYLNAKMQYFRDVYTSEKESGRYTDYRQRYDTYFKVSSASKVDEASFAVVDSHMTRYNESMILIKYTPETLRSVESNLLSVVGTVLYIEAQVSDAFEVQAEYELFSAIRQPQNQPEIAHYLYREKGNKFLSNSEFLNSTVEFPVYIYKYASPKWNQNTQPMVSYNGLWSKFTRELLRNLTLTTQQTKTKFKNLGEKYNPAYSNLSREIVSYFAQLKLNGIEFESDTMKLDLSVNEIFNK
jgi:hypothetical protein